MEKTNEICEINMIKNICSKVLSEMTFNIMVLKKSGEESAEMTKKAIMNQCNITEKIAANIVRMAVGTYLNKEDYTTEAIKSIAQEI